MKIAKTPQNPFQLISLGISTHVLTNPQLWITHPLPLSGLTCLQKVIAASLAFPEIPPVFSSNCSNRVPKRREGIEASTCTILVRFLFLSPWILSCKSQWWGCAELNRGPHENPTVNETGIVVLLRLFWVSAGKERKRLRYERYFSQVKHDIEISNGENAWNWVAQFSRRSNGELLWDRRFSETSLVGCEKKKGF